MSRVILEPYDVYTSPVNELSTLEDVMEKGYDVKLEHNVTDSISIREQPSAIPYAIDSLLNQGLSKYFGVIERHAVLYGVSLVEATISQIAKQHRQVSDFGSVRDLKMKLHNSKGLIFCTMTDCEKRNIPMPYWCKEYIQTTCRYLNMPASKLTTYMEVIALDRSSIANSEVKELIHEETEWFMKYLQLESQKFISV